MCFQHQFFRFDLGEIEDVVDLARGGSAQSRTVDRYSRCCGVSWLLRTSSVMPITALSGVRISWLMLARKGLRPVGRFGGFLGPRKASAARSRGDVLRDAEGADDLPRIVIQRAVWYSMTNSHVRPARFLSLPSRRSRGRCEQFPARGQGLQGVLVGKEVDVGLADRFVGMLQAKEACRGPVNANETAAGVLEIDSLRQVIHERVQQVRTPVASPHWQPQARRCDRGRAVPVRMRSYAVAPAIGGRRGKGASCPTGRQTGRRKSAFPRFPRDKVRRGISQRAFEKEDGHGGPPSGQSRSQRTPMPTAGP